MTNPNFQLSILDLSPISSGTSAMQALQETLDLARFADGLGFNRYWMSEHHNTPLMASASPEILIGHVAQVTKNLRVGSGGMMLPNHAPLKVAENFRLLSALHPNRIDLGLGRAPGTDPTTALALRRSRHAPGAESFPQQLEELLGFLGDDMPHDSAFRFIRAIPEGAPSPEVWLLGSSDFSALVAAQLGLSFAFAHHISPQPAVRALQLYRERFVPSRYLQTPRSLVAISAVCAPTNDEARVLAVSADLAWLNIRQGKRAPLPSVEEANAYPYSADEREFLAANRERLFVGSPQTLRTQIGDLATRAATSEIMVTTLMHDPAARLRSYELLADAFQIAPAVLRQAA